MLKDIGFWDINGNYIEDIQEVDEMEMDNEIIIDGVNVAGCEEYFEQSGEVVCALIDQYFCEGNPDCYYKQLKRLEQENAELKAENERLLHQKNTMTAQYSICYATLAEIKKIAGKLTCKPEECGMNKPDWNGEVYGCNAGQDAKDLACCPSALANYILQKISEVME